MYKLLKEQKEILTDKLNKRAKKYQNRFVNTLIESIKPEDKSKDEKVKVYDKNLKINENVHNMIDDIDKMLNE